MRKPTFLRWTEEAEAEHVRAWAVLEPDPEPQCAGDRPNQCARPLSPPRQRPVLFPWLRSLLGSQD